MRSVVRCTRRTKEHPARAPPAILLGRMTGRREKPVRFEIMRLDEVDGTTVDSVVVDAASVDRIVQQAAATGQRLWIRPSEEPVP
ncbi:hypothetical protein STXM2123_4482 [Streptomyces sp. F-3]|nr:hypothetical protein STXM2123_4482 [Streptomyces sp. F-3]